MKKPLHLMLAVFSALMLQQQTNAQITLISNNTNIMSGLVLPANNKPVMLDSAGGLWTTDGTTATKITTAVTHPNDKGMAVYNNKLYFAGTGTDNDLELWVTDGTAGGTALVKNIAATGSSGPDDFFVFNNILYFTADDGVHGRELWQSNGSIGNASMVADINPGAGSGLDSLTSFFQNGSNVYFSAKSASDSGLYVISTSGTPALVKNIAGQVSVSILDCAALGGKTIFTVRTGDFFTGTTQLWVTQGTATSTQMLYDFGFGSSSLFPQPVVFNNLLFFDGIDLLNGGVELWSTDGTVANTKLFKDINPGTNGSYPELLSSALINGKMFFGASTDANGYELWSTDGTPNGTTLFKDIDPGSGDATPVFLANIGAYTNLIKNSNVNNFNFQQLYSTKFNGKWYFTASDGTHGTELWSTDGTAGGTQMVKDINPGTGDGAGGDGSDAFFTTSGIYFVGDNGTSGAEPFFTDGTPGGTNLVKDLNPTANAGSDPSYMFLFNSQIYLHADNGDNSQGLVDLYKIDQGVTVLPVNLLTFNAALLNGGVALNWATSSEINTSNFIVERSIDAVHFNAVGTVAAAGISNMAHQYQYNDASAVRAGVSTLYYRLRVVDKDGRFTYTPVLSVQLQGSMFKITLSPNPVHDRLTVSFATGNTNHITLKVMDANGKPVYQQLFQTGGAASMLHNINVSGYAAGTYFIQLITDKDTKTIKFVKQ